MELSELLFNIFYGSSTILACFLVFYAIISWSIEELKYIQTLEDDDEYEIEE